MIEKFQWIPFYQALADKLLAFEDRRKDLYDIIKELADQSNYLNYFHFENEEQWKLKDYQVDPFSVMGSFNRQLKNSSRIEVAKLYADKFNITATLPNDYTGIPVLNNLDSIYKGANEIWELFVSALQFAEDSFQSKRFIDAYNQAIKIATNGQAKLTIGLFLIRPNHFMPLDGNSRVYIPKTYRIKTPEGRYMSGQEYVEFLSELKKAIMEKDPGLTFAKVSHQAHLDKKDAPDVSVEPENDEQSGIFTQYTEPIQTKNMIFYGPPGTGKTYLTVPYAIAIIEGKPFEEVASEDRSELNRRYKKYKDQGLIEFVTFHQSFGYEEFVEGIRPTLDDNEEGETKIEYEVHSGVFKAFCDKAGTPVSEDSKTDFGLNKNPTVWKVSLAGTGSNPIRQDCLENGYIRIGFDEYGQTISDETDFSKYGGRNVLNAFYNKMQVGDIVFSCFSSKTIDAIGVITDEPEWKEELGSFKRLRNVNWLIKDINYDIVEINAGNVMTLSTIYALKISATTALAMLKELKPGLFSESLKIPNRVFIIDEINRGNISKIFGELITLIESSKRLGAKEELRAKLPYSKQSFGVPDNVFIIGTMNSTDRSIAMIDTALRRRFSFISMTPDSSVLEGIAVNDIYIPYVLDIINERLNVLLDRDHLIGHSFFMPLKAEPTLKKLGDIFENELVPLLQEYFYDDYDKIRFVLGDNQKDDISTQFIQRKQIDAKLFGSMEIDKEILYEINPSAFRDIEAYAFLTQDL